MIINHTCEIDDVFRAAAVLCQLRVFAVQGELVDVGPKGALDETRAEAGLNSSRSGCFRLLSHGRARTPCDLSLLSLFFFFELLLSKLRPSY